MTLADPLIDGTDDFYHLDRLYADLDWALGLPSLLNPKFQLQSYALRHQPSLLSQPQSSCVTFASLPDQHPWTERDDGDNSKLSKALYERIHASLQRHKHKTLRLGIYFEELLGVWLQEHPNITIEKSHEPICGDDGRTLGELDWILQGGLKEPLEHWECSVKFYLAASQGQDLSTFRGPNLDDHMARKLNHMIGHQLPLSLKRYVNARPFCSMVGQVFFRWRPGDTHWSTISECAAVAPRLTSASLPWLNPLGQARAWISEHDCEAFLESFRSQQTGPSSGKLQLQELPKLLWLSPLRTQDWEILQRRHRLADSRHGARLCALVNTNALNNHISEITRFFIVPQDLAEQFDSQ